MNGPVTGTIVLVGFMGTGKTTVGKLLAWRFGMTFIDMDHVIEQRAGKAVSRIFAEDGEPHFRALERGLVVELSKGQGQVIGAGGGIVLNPDNIRDFQRTGAVVCLTARPEVILGRLAGDESRPLLQGDAKAAKVLALLESRRALYEAIPFKVDTSGLTPEDVVAGIASVLKLG